MSSFSETEVVLDSDPRVSGMSGGDALTTNTADTTDADTSQTPTDETLHHNDVNKDADRDSLSPDSENGDKQSSCSGDESDIEDNVEPLYPSQRLARSTNPELPETTVTLETESGGKVYVVGTAHFSEESQNDVVKLIRETQPDSVMVELCRSRINVLELDEETLLEEAKNMNMAKIKAAVHQGGFIRGIMHLLLLNMSAHITKQLGMAPGGEFRTAVREAQNIPGCQVYLGDRPIQITLRRAFAALSFWQKVKLAWHMITNRDPISKEEVEKCKQKDLLEEMMKEMTGEYPALSRVFVSERDLYLAHSLHVAANTIPSIETEDGVIVPPVIVGVVGMGHVAGIVENWNNITDEVIAELMISPETSRFYRLFKWTIGATFIGLLSWGVTNVEYHCGKAEDVLPNVMRNLFTKDIIAIVDPPRAGLHQRVVHAIRRCTAINRFIYVSCNPPAAKQNFEDLIRPESKRTRGKPLVPTRAVPVDLFPDTTHCELIILFERYHDKMLETHTGTD